MIGEDKVTTSTTNDAREALVDRHSPQNYVSLPGGLPRRSYIRVACAAVGIFAVVYVLDAFLAWLKMPAEATLIDDILLGLLVGVLVLLQEISHQRELRREHRQLAIIAEMNHHVRNALQTIVYVGAELNDRSAIEQIKAATCRIEWALREVLPGTAIRDDTGDSAAGSRPGKDVLKSKP